ncbi:hypothetical protein [Amorphus orientalis]|uniref:Uncharacterized protein n=1 Tax=Amorphus orientalis TaxID=649198 RepID=A0AAE3VL95_9HYPH|nr:hypothetical protein [Amorphus orientalis]MDQ0314117.1 hypothetical protein [Amorphus orientalis]
MNQTWFRIFKWTVYGALAIDTILFLSVEGKVNAFIDSMAWIVLIGVMEYESSTLGEGYSGRREKLILTALNVFAYSMIVYSIVGYFAEGQWTDVVNDMSWLGVCAVLVYQMYAPGDYEGNEYRAVKLIKAALYFTLIVCAVIWTVVSQKILDAVDAWLWLLCFAVIELNVFGFEADQEERAAEEASEAAGVA